jgi:hypothetical protein
MARVTGESGILNKLSDQAQEIASEPPHEGEMTRKIEQQTAKIPSIGFLGLAVGSMVASAALAFFARKKELANFVGLWAPSLLLIGVYNKLVKMEAEGGFGQRGMSGGMSGGIGGRRTEGVSGQSESHGGSQGYGQSYGVGQGASTQGVSGESYTGV